MDMVPNPKDALEEIKIEDEVDSGVSSVWKLECCHHLSRLADALHR